MVEAAKELLEMVKHAPEYTLWVLLGILFYKVFIAGSWIMIVRLLILKAHDVITRPRVAQYKIGTLVMEDAIPSLELLLSLIKKPNLTYVHRSDLDVLLEYAKKLKEEKK